MEDESSHVHGSAETTTASTRSGTRRRHVQVHLLNNGDRDVEPSRSSCATHPALKIPPNLAPQDSLLGGSFTTLEQKQRHVRSFLAQKYFRTRKSTNVRKYFLWFVTFLSLLVAWVIGYYQYPFALLFVLLVVMVIVWRDQSWKIVRGIEQETEIRVKRKKTLQHSETAEWVNLAINRWWLTCSDSVVEFLKDYLEPLLQDMAPAGVDHIELVDFDLAHQTPFVKNIQLFDPPAQAAPQRLNEYMLGSQGATQTTIVANLELGIMAPDSKIVLRARLGGKSYGYDTLVYVEGLHLNGSVQSVVTIDNSAPFPHIACLTATFPQKPDLWFTVRVLKGLKVTEIPLLKSWIHTFIMDIFTTLLVDPGKLTINVQESGPLGPSLSDPPQLAEGVVTVTIRGAPPQKKSKYANDPRRWCTLRIGQQKQKLRIPVGKDTWEATFCFLVHNLKEDALVLKIKHIRVMRNLTLAIHSVSLNSLSLDNDRGTGEEREKTIFVSNDECSVALDFHFSCLPELSLDSPILPSPPTQVAGVLYVHLHSGSNLLSSDADGLSDPYCVVLINKKKIFSTHYVLDTLNPVWERGRELFVTDFTQASLTFVVCVWDGPLISDDLLGVAKLNMQLDKPEILKQKLELEIDGSTTKQNRSLGHITVSVVFRPCDAVAEAELPSVTMVTAGENAAKVQPTFSAQITKQQMKKASKLLKNKRLQQPYEDTGIIELTIVRGKNLVAKDLNGFSDPYIVVKYGDRTVFRSRVVKKSLDPEWNENATLSAPHPDDVIRVECWDKDTFTDDFMGSFEMEEGDLVQFRDGVRWCKLEHVPNGDILLGLVRIRPRETSGSLHSEETSSQRGAGVQGDQKSLDTSSYGSHASHASHASCTPSIHIDSDSDSNYSAPLAASAQRGSSLTNSPCKHPPVDSAECQLESRSHLGPPSLIRRRHTITPTTHSAPPSLNFTRFHDDASLVSSNQQQQQIQHSLTQTDIDRALRASNVAATRQKKLVSERLLWQRDSTLFHSVSGQVIEADGLKGNLDHLELYIKVRLNIRPSYQRQYKFSRGPVVHKTRPLRGSTNPQWREDFTVKESPVPSDSLLTLDLKSGSKVNIGTHAITLERFFDGNHKATRWLDIGNDMRLRIRLTHQITPNSLFVKQANKSVH